MDNPDIHRGKRVAFMSLAEPGQIAIIDILRDIDILSSVSRWVKGWLDRGYLFQCTFA